ncbi:GNAT family N-acetyltransferase [Shewanella sp. UCD-KL12]|uniref:GNAT family N-acetyltransferase n=1 Tax=Shewanella sp. UCD-KL12 TaxID=1917163 RepID=UPI00274132D6|nr:GNAT family N-acetyltransferase [Shewanella sp. UCD-KL12]
MRKRLQASNEQFVQGDAVHFVALPINDDPDFAEIIGVCNFTNIVRGPFQACHLGYSVAEKYQGQGLMHEILHAGIDYMFDELKLHRIMANYMPAKTRSGKLLQTLGFEKEGVAKSYLKIAGKWQDHVLTAKVNSL